MAVSIAMLTTPAAWADAVWGTGTASEMPNPDGYYEYCFHIEWNTTGLGGYGLSLTDVFLSLEGCVIACDPWVFDFPDPAGVGEGEGGCEVSFTGEFLCKGDPTSPEFDSATIKFEGIPGECEPGPTGSLDVCFLSHLIPNPDGPSEYPDALGIKFATNTETGPLVGVLPLCQMSAAEVASWGVVKALYK
jgi:hypothetical protein